VFPAALRLNVLVETAAPERSATPPFVSVIAPDDTDTKLPSWVDVRDTAPKACNASTSALMIVVERSMAEPVLRNSVSVPRPPL